MPPLERAHLFKGAFVKCLAFKGGGRCLFEGAFKNRGAFIWSITVFGRWSDFEILPIKISTTHFFCLWGSVFVFLYSLVEWLSGLRWYNENGKDPGSNITRCSARPWDSNSSQGFWWPSGQIKNQTQWLTLSYWAASSTVAQSWPGDSQVAIKKNKTFSTKALCNIFIFT